MAEGLFMSIEGKKRREKKESQMAENDNRRSGKKVLAGILYIIGAFFAGVLAAALTAKINGKVFGLYTWPLAACVALFVFSTTGFFLTEGNREVLYGACSIASVICAIVQLAILF